MKSKACALAVFLGVLPALPVGAGVFYSPVFNMPLQSAPSPSNGGYYWPLPNGGVYGPCYYLVPPFNPVSGFDNAAVGREIFGKLYEEALSGGKSKNAGGKPPPTKQVGFGGYTMDYSDPNCFKNFDAPTPLINGYVPFAPSQQPPPQYGNSPLPMPRYANYPNFQAYAPAPGYAPYPSNMSAYTNYYSPGYYGAGYQGYGATPWQNPVVQAQAIQPYPPPALPMGPAYPGANMAGLPSLPYYPTPNFSMPQYPTPIPPSYSMPPAVFPPLPNPSYEPPPGHNGNPCKYFHSPLVRSPRDFFMWNEVQEDKALRARRPMIVP